MEQNNEQFNSIEEEQELELEENRKKRYIRQNLLLILLLIILVVTVSTLSYAFYREYTDLDPSGDNSQINTIKSGEILFSYSDVDGQGNGINIVNARPISDEEGKALFSSHTYFDFQILADTSVNLQYEIVALKENNSTLSEQLVKIYLTKVDGTLETPISSDPVKTYGEYEDTKLVDTKGKTLYQETISKGTKVQEQYRLRMWVKEDATNYSNKQFSLRINVYAAQVK